MVSSSLAAKGSAKQRWNYGPGLKNEMLFSSSVPGPSKTPRDPPDCADRSDVRI